MSILYVVPLLLVCEAVSSPWWVLIGAVLSLTYGFLLFKLGVLSSRFVTVRVTFKCLLVPNGLL